MLSKVKKIFFNATFAALYISFVGQLIYVLTQMPMDKAVYFLAGLSVEWLVLMSARYVMKKSGGQKFNNFGGHGRGRR